MNLFDLTGKTALITGGAHGLGMSMAKGLGYAGAKIIVNDLSKEALDKAVAEYRKLGIEAYGYAFDVTDKSVVIDCINTIETEVAPIDILINNAGIIKRSSIVEMKTRNFTPAINLDLISPFSVSKNVAKGMIERGGGKVINICSMMSELGRVSVSAHAAAKRDLKILTLNMVTEWAKYNIQVNGICASSTASIREDEQPCNKFAISKILENRWEDSKDLQDATIFLSSKASDYVNGHILHVDGGVSGINEKKFN